MRSLAAALLVLAGCGGPGRIVPYEEDFETLCDGTPCGWVQTLGPPGAVSYLETIPGDHGLSFTGDGVVARGGARTLASVSLLEIAEVSGRCDDGSSLELRISVIDETGVAATLEAVSMPGAEWSIPEPIPLSAPPGRLPGVREVVGVLVRKLGPGACEIDRLVLDVRSAI